MRSDKLADEAAAPRARLDSILGAALAAVDPGRLIHDHLRRDGDLLVATAPGGGAAYHHRHHRSCSGH